MLDAGLETFSSSSFSSTSTLSMSRLWRTVGDRLKSKLSSWTVVVAVEANVTAAAGPERGSSGMRGALAAMGGKGMARIEGAVKPGGCNPRSSQRS